MTNNVFLVYLRQALATGGVEPNVGQGFSLAVFLKGLNPLRVDYLSIKIGPAAALIRCSAVLPRTSDTSLEWCVAPMNRRS